MKKSSIIVIFLTIILPLILTIYLFVNVSKLLENNFFIFTDTAIVINKNISFQNLLNLWNKNNLGYVYSLYTPIVTLSKFISLSLLKLNFSIKLMEIYFYGFMTLAIYYSSFFVFYKIQKLLFDNKNLLIPAIAALFYSCGLPVLIQVGILDTVFNILVISPIIFLLLIKNQNNTNDKLWKNIVLQGFFIICVLSSPPFSLAFLITMYVPYFLFVKNLLSFNFLKYYLGLVIIVLIGGAFFIYPLVYAYLNIHQNVFYTAPNVGTNDFVFLTNGLRGIYQFVYDWTASALLFYSPGDPHAFYNYYYSLIGPFSSFLIWFISFLSISINWKTIKNKKIFIYVILCLLLTIFFIKGDQAPFRNLSMFFYKISPIFEIFRTPSSKFGFPIFLYLSTIIVLVLNTNKYLFLNILLVIAIILQTIPFFNPYRFIGYETAKAMKTVAYIPKDYITISHKLNQDKKEGSVIFYPGHSFGRFDFHGTKYIGQDFLGKLIDRPVIYSDDTTMKLSYTVIHDILKKFDPKITGNSSIRYIIIRKDFIENGIFYKNNISKKESDLINNKYSLIYRSQLLDLYEINPIYFKNLITLVKNNQDTTIIYQNSSSNSYKITLPINDLNNVTIVFRNSYHKDWNLKGLNKKYFNVKHVVYNGFENGWQISKKPGASLDLKKKVTIEIYYQPQNIFYILIFISLITIIVVGHYLI